MTFIDFGNQANLELALGKLAAQHTPRFGMMTPQHMVEHLALVLSISNGKRDVPMVSGEEQLPGLLRFLEGPHPLPEGFKAPFLKPDSLMPLYFSNLDEAREGLYKEIEDFKKFYTQHPYITKVHPVFGPLNKTRWEIFHNKHFTHHLSQFNLL